MLSNDVRVIDQINTVSVEELTVRGNPALKVTFPQSDALEVYFVNDPGDSYWMPNLMTVLVNKNKPMGDGHLTDYLNAGQDGFGSDPIALGTDGHILIHRARFEDFKRIDDPEVLVAPFDVNDFMEDASDMTMTDLLNESGVDENAIVLNGTQFLNADAVILASVARDKVGLNFLLANAPRLNS